MKAQRYTFLIDLMGTNVNLENQTGLIPIDDSINSKRRIQRSFGESKKAAEETQTFHFKQFRDILTV